MGCCETKELSREEGGASSTEEFDEHGKAAACLHMVDKRRRIQLKLAAAFESKPKPGGWFRSWVTSRLYAVGAIFLSATSDNSTCLIEGCRF
jgi:hypothetical protein